MATSTEAANVSLSPSKISDFYHPCVKSSPHPDKESDVDDSLLSSSVLLTPDASPIEVKDAESETTSVCADDKCATPTDTKTITDSCKKCDERAQSSDRELEHIKVLPKGKDVPPSTPPISVPKKRRGRTGRVKSAQSTVAVDKPLGKTMRKKKTATEVQSKTITDYFPVRRSGRQCASSLKKGQQKDLEEKILSKSEDGLKVVEIEGKGRGVISTREFKKGDFVVEYVGDLIDVDQAKKKENQYSRDPDIGCYMYYFLFKNKQYCVDATAESPYLGRLLNHSRLDSNCQTKVVDIKNHPYLILVASRDITQGEELLYDYGDRSKAALEAHPWLKS
ncbi:N-lysine methyltransferase KMT5A-like [Gigantopelta aegis]|uniref:N-lysine methyltransferase KMT5A-like n=1 Tax=Gigantopelta aegis TaxID=1735272 RepID=UPI001B8885FB|nr:N-lysine methyltransferase KMT5A-like [Gigantopelta aegis]XP_041348615.1 N-lysine methyltransferase KMT5A-like [Gigantopelta aegis]